MKRILMLGTALLLVGGCDSEYKETPEDAFARRLAGSWHATRGFVAITYGRDGGYSYRSDEAIISGGRYTLRLVRADTFEIRYTPAYGQAISTDKAWLPGSRELNLRSLSGGEVRVYAKRI